MNDRGTKISIVTVCYNSGRTVKRLIESILSQAYDNIEFIIIDGGSSDDTTDIVKQYCDGIAFFSSEPDEGVYDAMNKGISKSTGDILAFINSDDWLEEGVLKNIAELYEKERPDIIYGDYAVVWGKDKIHYTSQAGICMEELYYRGSFCHQAMFFKKNIFNTLGGYDLCYRIAADYDLILRAYNKNAVFRYYPGIICYFQKGGVSTRNAEGCAEEAREIALRRMPDDRRQRYSRLLESCYEEKKARMKYDQILFEMLNGNTELSERVGRYLKIVKKPVYIFGAGYLGRQCIWLLDASGIAIGGVVDNCQDKWGTRLEEREISSPELLEENKKFVIIAMKVTGEVTEQLNRLGYREKSDYIYYTDMRIAIVNQINQEAEECIKDHV